MEQIEPEQANLPAAQLCAGPGNTELAELPLCVAGEWIEAEVLHQYLIHAAESQSSLTLDFAELAYVDAPCFQLLLAAESAGLLAENKVQFAHLSDAVKRCFVYAGAESLLQAGAKVA